jgi:hypothetical protein
VNVVLDISEEFGHVDVSKPPEICRAVIVKGVRNIRNAANLRGQSQNLFILTVLRLEPLRHQVQGFLSEVKAAT